MKRASAPAVVGACLMMACCATAGCGGASCDLQGHTKLVARAALSPDGKQVATVAGTNEVWLWDAGNGKCVGKWAPDGSTWAVAFSPDNRYFVYSVDERKKVDGALRDTHDVVFIDRKSRTEACRIHKPDARITGLMFAPNGQLVMASQNEAWLWDVDKAKFIREFPAADGAGMLVGLACSKAGDRLFQAYFQQVRWLDVTSGQAHVIGRPNPGAWFRCVACTADGMQAVTGGSDTLVRLWDVEGGKEIRQFAGHTHVVDAAAISADGRTVLSGGSDGTVRVWDAGSGKLKSQIDTPKGAVSVLAYSADGDRILFTKGKTAHVRSRP